MKLSPREWEVASLAWDGLMDKEIADEMGVHLCTVRKHWENIFKRLEIRQPGGRASRQTVFRKLLAEEMLKE